MPNVTIYTTPSCHACKQAKEYLRKKDVNISIINLAQDNSKAEEMIRKSGQASVPVIEIDNEVICGFNKKKIDEACN